MTSGAGSDKFPFQRPRCRRPNPARQSFSASPTWSRRSATSGAVDGLSLEVRRGEIFGFLGPNGAGKTTTIKLMCGLLRPDEGTIAIDGSIGLSPQSIVIWETLTPFEQLAFIGRMHGLDGRNSRRRADVLIDAFGLREKSGQLARTLSGGMQRRLNIALALVHEPDVPLPRRAPGRPRSPEPRPRPGLSSGRWAPKTTVVLTTHDMEEAEKLSDRVCIIDRGKVLVLDTVAEHQGRRRRGDLVEIESGEAGPKPSPAILLELGADEAPSASRAV